MDSLNEGNNGEGLNATVSKTSGKGTIVEELEGVVNHVMVQLKEGHRHIQDLEVGAEVVDGDKRAARGVTERREAVEGALELGEVAGEGGRAGEDGGELEGLGGEGDDES